MKIGNIVTANGKAKFNDVFNVVKSFDDIIPDIPTLVVGVENARKWIDGFNILTKSYGDVWWTYKKTERRCDYEEDVVSFYEHSVNSAMEKVKYTYVDLMRFSLTNIKKMVWFAKSDYKKTMFLTKDSKFMFIYSKDFNTVFGVSLTLCEYLGLQKKRIIALLKNSTFVNASSFIDSDLRRVIGTNTHYILPLYEYFQK